MASVSTLASEFLIKGRSAMMRDAAKAEYTSVGDTRGRHLAEPLRAGPHRDFVARYLVNLSVATHLVNRAAACCPNQLGARSFPRAFGAQSSYFIAVVPPTLRVGCPPAVWPRSETGGRVFRVSAFLFAAGDPRPTHPPPQPSPPPISGRRACVCVRVGGPVWAGGGFVNNAEAHIADLGAVNNIGVSSASLRPPGRLPLARMHASNGNTRAPV